MTCLLVFNYIYLAFSSCTLILLFRAFSREGIYDAAEAAAAGEQERGRMQVTIHSLRVDNFCFYFTSSIAVSFPAERM